MSDVSKAYLEAQAAKKAGIKTPALKLVPQPLNGAVTSDKVLTPTGDIWKGYDTPKSAWLTGTVLLGLAFGAYKLGQESVRKQKSSLPSLGTLLGTYIAFKALDALWPSSERDEES